MSNLRETVNTLHCLFIKYAGKDGNNTMSKKELRELLQNEYADKVNIPANQLPVDEFFKMLDNDQDGTVDFQEFASFVAALCAITFCDK